MRALPVALAAGQGADPAAVLQRGLHRRTIRIRRTSGSARQGRLDRCIRTTRRIAATSRCFREQLHGARAISDLYLFDIVGNLDLLGRARPDDFAQQLRRTAADPTPTHALGDAFRKALALEREPGGVEFADFSTLCRHRRRRRSRSSRHRCSDAHGAQLGVVGVRDDRSRRIGADHGLPHRPRADRRDDRSSASTASPRSDSPDDGASNDVLKPTIFDPTSSRKR